METTFFYEVKMTINSDISRARYVGNGITATFAIPFAYLTNSDGTAQVAIYLGDSDIPLVEGKDYTVKGFGKYSDASEQDEDLITYETRYENGEFTLVNAPALGQAVAVIRDVPQTQGIVFVEGEKFPAQDFENGLDKLTMEVQEVKENLTRAIVLPPTSDEKPLEARDAILLARDEAVVSANQALASEKASEENKNIAVNSANEATASKNIILNDVGFQVIATDLLGDNKIGYVAENLDSVASNVAGAVAAATLANQAADRANEIAEASKIEIENKSQSALNDILRKTEDAKSDIQSATSASITNINNTVSAEIIPNLEGYISSATNYSNQAKNYAESIDSSAFVKTSGNQDIYGTKTFRGLMRLMTKSGSEGAQIDWSAGSDSTLENQIVSQDMYGNKMRFFARNSAGFVLHPLTLDFESGLVTTAANPPASDNSLKLATTAWVKNAIKTDATSTTITYWE